METFWKNLVAGKSGIDKLTAFDVEAYPCKIGGEVRDFEPKPFYNNPKETRRSDRYAHLAMAAAKMAVAQAGIDFDDTDRDRVGVMIGSGIGGLATLEKQEEILLTKGPSRVSPFIIPMMISNIASGQISMEYGLRGPNMAIVTACATSNHNIGEAWRMIKFGDADAFIAGGSEASITPLGLSGFSNMRALSTRNDEPQKASRPFDVNRDGFVMGEGAGVVVIEELEHAKKRGANILCELSGYGVSADAHHLTAPLPDGAGARKCMQNAMRHAGVNASDMDYVNAHGTSTPVGDMCEIRAMKAAFGERAKNGMLVSSTKSMTGHLLGAAGGIELAACAMAIRDGVVPPTINLDDPDPEADLDCVPHTAREATINTAISNSFGFGGHNASVVLQRFTD